MKRVLAVGALLFVLWPTYGGETGDAMARRTVRGLTNATTGIVELPMQVKKGYEAGVPVIDSVVLSKAWGTLFGVFRGCTHALGRTSTGILELVTFWAALPDNNRGIGIPLDGPNATDEGVRYCLITPTIHDGLAPVGHKLKRGLANGILGFWELPGQTVRGLEKGHLGCGVSKGVWFTLSRHVHGIGETATFLLPNLPDTQGATLDDEWPWDALW